MNMPGQICASPFERSFWVVPGTLLAGCYPGDQKSVEAERKLNAIIGAGIRTFLNLMEPHEKNRAGAEFVPYEPQMKRLAAERGVELSIVRMPVRDEDVPSVDFMAEILEAIDDSLRTGKPVYVHCWGGWGRTGTVVGCYLREHGFANGEAALRRVAELRSKTADSRLPAPMTPAQVEMVRNWRPKIQSGARRTIKWRR